ncbi:NfeD family protein [Vibrio gangliei]|uniref:NfeD family protein n=1 Tax=Vibrio gangliei TaxID=2077090 RepID=UPI000D01A353|nr:NfeD family protein [Vibrio gangliei]
MEWIASYLPQVLMTLGVIALIIEAAVLGFATFILFFVGLSFVISGFSMYMGWLPDTVNSAIWSNIIFTAALAVVLWRPLKQLQNKPSTQKLTSDFAQKTFVLDANVDADSETILHSYSGITWKVKSETPLAAGQKVKVVKTEVGVMWVEAVQEPR